MWNFELVTERQLVIDCILLLMGHETPTFKRVPSGKELLAKSFVLRRPVYVSHLSPSILKEMLDKFLDFSKII